MKKNISHFLKYEEGNLLISGSLSIIAVLFLFSAWWSICLTLLSKVLSRTKPNSWSLTKLRSFFPALIMVTMTSWRMASSGSWDRTFRYSVWIIKMWEQRSELERKGEMVIHRGRKTKTWAEAHLSGLLPGLGGSWGSGWQTLHTRAWLEHECHWT